MQRLGNRLRDLALDCENVGQLAIESIRPKVRVGRGVNELDIHPHLVVRFLHAALEDVRYPELAGDLREIVRRTFEMLRRSAGDDFQVRNFRQPGQDFVLDALREVSVRFVFAAVFKRQDGDRFFRNRRNLPRRTSAGNGGTWFALASFFELLRHGRVAYLLSVEIHNVETDAMLHFALTQIVQARLTIADIARDHPPPVAKEECDRHRRNPSPAAPG